MTAVDELNALLGIGPERPHLPSTLERAGFRAIKVLGKGAFGQAILVYHEGRKQHFVAKHVNLSTMKHSERKSARNEISVLQKLRHVNVIRYEEFYEEQNHLYIIMEWADGGDLATHLKKVKKAIMACRANGNDLASARLSEDVIMNLFIQIAMGVKCCHDQRVLHRDIAPKNVFLTQEHVVKLGDMGISTVLQNTMSMAKTMCGTPFYFSPELCKGQPYNNKSDVWQLGIVLFEMAMLRVPWYATNVQRLMEEIVTKDPVKLERQTVPGKTYSDKFWDLVSYMLIKDPIQRPDINAVLRHRAVTAALPRIESLLASAQKAHKEHVHPDPEPVRPKLSTNPLEVRGVKTGNLAQRETTQNNNVQHEPPVTPRPPPPVQTRYRIERFDAPQKRAPDIPVKRPEGAAAERRARADALEQIKEELAKHEPIRGGRWADICEDEREIMLCEDPPAAPPTEDPSLSKGLKDVIRNIGTLRKHPAAGSPTDAQPLSASSPVKDGHNASNFFVDSLGTCVDIDMSHRSCSSSKVSSSDAQENTEEENEEETEGDEGPVITAGCHCGASHVECALYAIFGTFTCTCNLCQRVSGSSLGVEWIHLPEIQTAQLLEGVKYKTYSPSKPKAHVYYCSSCGSLLIMEHSDVEGCVLSSASLTGSSKEQLLNFKKTVKQNGHLN